LETSGELDGRCGSHFRTSQAKKRGRSVRFRFKLHNRHFSGTDVGEVTVEGEGE